jgi:hypothetical protein
LLLAAAASLGAAILGIVYDSTLDEYLQRVASIGFDTSIADDAAELITPGVAVGNKHLEGDAGSGEFERGGGGGSDVRGAHHEKNDGEDIGGGGDGVEEVGGMVPAATVASASASTFPSAVADSGEDNTVRTGISPPSPSPVPGGRSVGGGSGDHSRLPHVGIRGDKLACKCGAGEGASCASYDYPDVAYVLADLKSTAAVVQALEMIHHGSISSSTGEAVEILVREWPGVSRDEVTAAAKRLSEDGRGGGSGNGGGMGLYSYRGEPLERVSIVVADSSASEARSTLAMASGAFATRVAVVRTRDLPPRAAAGASAATAEPLPAGDSKAAAISKLGGGGGGDGGGSGGSGGSGGGGDPAPDVSFAMQYFRRPALVKKIGEILASYHTKHGRGPP